MGRRFHQLAKPALAFVSLIAILVSATGMSCSPKRYSGEPAPVTLGGLVSDGNLMFFVAEDRHFFENNGIIFTHKIYGTGVETIGELMNDKIDIAGSAEYPIATKAFETDNISIIANIDKSYVIDFLGLTDRGIKT